MRAQKGKDVAASEANKDDRQADSERSDPPRPTKMVLRPEVVIPCTAPLPPPAPQTVEKPQAVVPAVNNEEPEHPFTNARDASYAVPSTLHSPTRSHRLHEDSMGTLHESPWSP